MKYCTKCGAKLIEGAKFCTVCGNRVDQNAPEQNVQTSAAAENQIQAAEAVSVQQPEKKKPRWGIIAAVIAAVLIIGVASAVLIPKFTLNAPKKFVEMHRGIITPVVDLSAQTVTRDLDPEKSGKIKEYSGIDTDFSVTVDLDTGSDIVDDIIKDSSVTFKVKSDPEKPLFGFILNLSGSDILSGTIVSEKDKVGISLPELSDEYYQIHYDDLEDILLALGMDPDMDIQSIIGAAYSTESPLGVDSEQLKAIIDSYLDVFFSMVKKENTSSSKEDVYLPGCKETIGCTVITFKPTAEDIKVMVKQLCDKLKDDEELRDIVGHIAEYAYLTDPNTADQYETSEEYVKYILESYDDTVKNLWDRNEKDIVAFAEDTEENEICWKIAYKALRVHMISITDKDANGVGYESVGNVLDMRTDLLSRYDENRASIIARSELKLSGKNAEGRIIVNELDEGNAQIDYSVDLSRKSGLKIPYGELKFSYGDIKADVNVRSEGSGSQHDIKIRNEDNDISIGIFSTDKESTVKEPSQVPTRVTPDNIMSVIQGMYGKIMEIFINIYG